MITARRRPGEITRRRRTRRRASERVLRPADPERTGDETGLLLAFVTTTLVMVVGVVVLAVLQLWWLLVPVVLVHWIATYVILARINGLLSR